jgi:hypothetical protein
MRPTAEEIIASMSESLRESSVGNLDPDRWANLRRAALNSLEISAMLGSAGIKWGKKRKKEGADGKAAYYLVVDYDKFYEGIES